MKEHIMYLDFPVYSTLNFIQSLQLSVSRSVNLLSIFPPPLPVVYLNKTLREDIERKYKRKWGENGGKKYLE